MTALQATGRPKGKLSEVARSPFVGGRAKARPRLGG
jgi:hypothetical protein